VRPTEVTDVVCTHLHVDHVGWLFDLSGRRVFPAATVWLGAGDWNHFVAGDGEMAAHIRDGFQRIAGTKWLRPLDGDAALATGLTARLTPGHTPGSLCVQVTSRGRRLLLLGDAITCPIQLEEPDWHSFGDTDPVLAQRTRAAIWQELGSPHTVGVGSHFPGLQPGRVFRTAHASLWVEDGGDARR
jgi:glyoxylase-like metal-dependent hydrolase (beta-lactamase superfamily II)